MHRRFVETVCTSRILLEALSHAASEQDSVNTVAQALVRAAMWANEAESPTEPGRAPAIGSMKRATLEGHLLTICIVLEYERSVSCREPHTFFRGSNLYSRVLTEYASLCVRPQIRPLLQELVADILAAADDASTPQPTPIDSGASSPACATPVATPLLSPALDSAVVTPSGRLLSQALERFIRALQVNQEVWPPGFRSALETILAIADQFHEDRHVADEDETTPSRRRAHSHLRSLPQVTISPYDEETQNKHKALTDTPLSTQDMLGSLVLLHVISPCVAMPDQFGLLPKEDPFAVDTRDPTQPPAIAPVVSTSPPVSPGVLPPKTRSMFITATKILQKMANSQEFKPDREPKLVEYNALIATMTPILRRALLGIATPPAAAEDKGDTLLGASVLLSQEAMAKLAKECSEGADACSDELSVRDAMMLIELVATMKASLTLHLHDLRPQIHAQQVLDYLFRPLLLSEDVLDGLSGLESSPASPSMTAMGSAADEDVDPPLRVERYHKLLDAGLRKTDSDVIHKTVNVAGHNRDGHALVLIMGGLIPYLNGSVPDSALSGIIASMDGVVRQPYSLAFVVPGTGSSQVGVTWIKSLYTDVLVRKYRKNLQSLVVLHAPRWFRSVVPLFKPLLSNKFWAKLKIVSTLPEMVKHVNVRDDTFVLPMDLLRDEKLNGAHVAAAPEGARQPLFGGTLLSLFRSQVALGIGETVYPGYIPTAVRDMCEYLSWGGKASPPTSIADWLVYDGTHDPREVNVAQIVCDQQGGVFPHFGHFKSPLCTVSALLCALLSSLPADGLVPRSMLDTLVTLVLDSYHTPVAPCARTKCVCANGTVVRNMANAMRELPPMAWATVRAVFALCQHCEAAMAAMNGTHRRSEAVAGHVARYAAAALFGCRGFDEPVATTPTGEPSSATAPPPAQFEGAKQHTNALVLAAHVCVRYLDNVFDDGLPLHCILSL